MVPIPPIKMGLGDDKHGIGLTTWLSSNQGFSYVSCPALLQSSSGIRILGFDLFVFGCLKGTSCSSISQWHPPTMWMVVFSARMYLIHVWGVNDGNIWNSSVSYLEWGVENSSQKKVTFNFNVSKRDQIGIDSYRISAYFSPCWQHQHVWLGLTTLQVTIMGFYEGYPKIQWFGISRIAFHTIQTINNSGKIDYF
jgi:hypothetical protein